MASMTGILSRSTFSILGPSAPSAVHLSISATPSPTPISDFFSTATAGAEDEAGRSKPATPTTPGKQLRFVDTPPQVYAYLDEQSESADNEGRQWVEGSRISFDAYQRMLQK